MEFFQWRLSSLPLPSPKIFHQHYRFIICLKISISLKVQFQFWIVFSSITKHLFLQFIKSFHVACLCLSIKQLLISWLSFSNFLQWLKLTSDDVKEQIYKLAKKGLTPSQIGKDYKPLLNGDKPSFSDCNTIIIPSTCIKQHAKRTQMFLMSLCSLWVPLRALG